MMILLQHYDYVFKHFSSKKLVLRKSLKPELFKHQNSCTFNEKKGVANPHFVNDIYIFPNTNNDHRALSWK